jgi:site-specific recombinase XerD
LHSIFIYKKTLRRILSNLWLYGAFEVMDKVLQLFKKDLLNKYSETTVKTYIFELKQFNEWLLDTGTNIFNYKKIDVSNYFNFLISKKSNSATINKIFHAIKIFSIWIDKYIFMENIRRPKQSKDFSTTDKFDIKSLKQILVNIKLSGTDRDFAIVMLMFYTGLKVTECVELDKDNVDFKKGILTVNNKIVLLKNELSYVLRGYLYSRKDDIKAFFISNRGSRLSIRSIHGIFEKYNIKTKQCKYFFNNFVATDIT